MTLTIKVNFEKGLDMEQNLNKAIDELSAVLEKKGLCEMELDGIDDEFYPIYKVTIAKDVQTV